MSDINLLFDLRIMQIEDGTWQASLCAPDEDSEFGWRHWPQVFNGFDGQWSAGTLDDLLVEVSKGLTVALDDNDE